ncbi:MAG: hypothetical protein EKK55_08490 [Rhodocyclaceae bacterium]|nr:MAG: hypothetical protein EKK55_08490 [Rhodocyclaceae bacterium]
MSDPRPAGVWSCETWDAFEEMRLAGHAVEQAKRAWCCVVDDKHAGLPVDVAAARDAINAAVALAQAKKAAFEACLAADVARLQAVHGAAGVLSTGARVLALRTIEEDRVPIVNAGDSGLVMKRCGGGIVRVRFTEAGERDVAEWELALAVRAS